MITSQTQCQFKENVMWIGAKWEKMSAEIHNPWNDLVSKVDMCDVEDVTGVWISLRINIDTPSFHKYCVDNTSFLTT